MVTLALYSDPRFQKQIQASWLIKILCTAAVACMILPGAVSAEDWPVKKFKIFKGVPARFASIGGNAIIRNRPDWSEMDEEKARTPMYRDMDVHASHHAFHAFSSTPDCSWASLLISSSIRL